MSTESRRISVVPKMEENPAADRWTELKLRAVRTEQPNDGPASEHQSTSRQQDHQQSGSVNLPSSTRNRQPTVEEYLDRITVAGLHNYLYAIERYEKLVWRITFLIAIVGTMFYLVTTIRAYLEFTIVLDIRHETEPSVRLPDVWVCAHTMNITFISEQFERARPKLFVDRRIRLHAERLRQVFKPTGPNYTEWNSSTQTWDTVPSVWNSSTTSWDYSLEDMIDRLILFSKHFSTMSPVGEDFTLVPGQAHIYEELLYIAVNSAGADWPGYSSFYEGGMFSCESVMKNCTLDGHSFDCCAMGDSMGYSSGTDRCFRLDTSQAALGKNVHQSSSSITLSFETTIDSLYFREFHSAIYAKVAGAEVSEATGVSVSFGPRMPGLFELTQPLAPATVSTLTVKAIKKLERTGCVRAYRFDPHLHVNSHSLLRNYFKEMIDPKRYTVGTCEMGKLLDAIYQQCGCVLYYDTIRPQNDSDICAPSHMYSCLYKVFHDVPPTEKLSSGNSSSAANNSLSAEDELKRATMRQLKAASASECLPLCESWTYDYRASSMIAEGPEGNVSRYFRNKVTIIFDPEYRVEMEVYKMDYSVLIASLGDGFGLILGFSAITLIQLPIWTIAAVVLRRQLNKISPPHRQGAITGHHRKTEENTV